MFLAEKNAANYRVGIGYMHFPVGLSPVMRGRVIGPLLFILYINDINDIASLFDDKSCVRKLYADDVLNYILYCKRRQIIIHCNVS